MVGMACKMTMSHKARFVMKKKEAEKQILLDHVGLTVEGKKIAKILSFFGVPWEASTTTELLASNKAWAGKDRQSVTLCAQQIPSCN